MSLVTFQLATENMHYQSSTYIKANISCISYHIASYGDHVFVVINFLPHNKKTRKEKANPKIQENTDKENPKDCPNWWPKQQVEKLEDQNV